MVLVCALRVFCGYHLKLGVALMLRAQSQLRERVFRRQPRLPQAAEESSGTSASRTMYAHSGVGEDGLPQIHEQTSDSGQLRTLLLLQCWAYEVHELAVTEVSILQLVVSESSQYLSSVVPAPSTSCSSPSVFATIVLREVAVSSPGVDCLATAKLLSINAIVLMNIIRTRYAFHVPSSSQCSRPVEHSASATEARRRVS